MPALPNVAMQPTENYTSVDELSIVVPTIRFNDAGLMLTAEATQARYFELTQDRTVMTDPELADGQATTRANAACSPAWGRDPDDYPDRAAPWSRLRRNNWVKFDTADSSKNDDAAFRKYLNMEMSKDGDPRDGFAAILEPFIGMSDYAANEVATILEERRMWWRIPTQSGWMELDFKKYCTSA